MKHLYLLTCAALCCLTMRALDTDLINACKLTKAAQASFKRGGASLSQENAARAWAHILNARSRQERYVLSQTIPEDLHTLVDKFYYLKTGETIFNSSAPYTTHYLYSFSIQELIDHARLGNFINKEFKGIRKDFPFESAATRSLSDGILFSLVLNLSERHIGSIEGLENIQGIENFEIIDLSNNKIQFINVALFKNLHRLTQIRLTGNPIPEEMREAIKDRLNALMGREIKLVF